MSFEETDVEIAEKDYGESGVKDVADDTGGVHPVVLAAVFGYFIVAFIVAVIVVQWTHICKQPTPSKVGNHGNDTTLLLAINLILCSRE